MKYRKLPVVITAVEWTGDNLDEIKAFSASSERDISKYAGSDELMIGTLEGTMVASVGDFLIKGIAGEFYPCKPDIFAKTYETC